MMLHVYSVEYACKLVSTRRATFVQLLCFEEKLCRLII